MDHATTFLVLAALCGLFMAWGIGANDVANAMATSVGSGAITIRQAVLIAAVFEFTGAFLAGGQVTATIRKGIIDADLLSSSPETLIFGMLAALLAAGTWLLVASQRGWPVSTTHSIVGAIVGFAVVGVGLEAVKWGKVSTIAISWIVSPLVAGTLSYTLFATIQRLILDKPKPFEAAKRYAPYYIFFSGFVIALVTMLKGLKHVGLDLTALEAYGIAGLVGLAVMGLGFVVIGRLQIDPDADRDFHFTSVEKVFGTLMIVTACGMAFAHGSNDVANAIGPVAAVVSIVQSGGQVGQQSPLAVWVLLLGATGIVVGLLTFGQRVIATVGHNITLLTPSRGFSCEIAAATTVVVASGTGLPISTTHTLVGAVLGVGLARGIAALNMRVVRGILMSWLVTLPAGALLSVLFFHVFRAVLGG